MTHAAWDRLPAGYRNSSGFKHRLVHNWRRGLLAQARLSAAVPARRCEGLHLRLNPGRLTYSPFEGEKLMHRRTATTGLAFWCLVFPWPALADPAADAAAPSATGTTTLRCGTLIDGVAATPRRDVAIRIEQGRIVSVGPYKPDAGTVIDRSQDTCLPGLIDAHAHVLIKTDDYQVDHLRRSSAYKALRGLNVVQEMLRSGWTTIRILGDADVAYAAPRRAHGDPGGPVHRSADHRRRSLPLDHGRRRRPELPRAPSTTVVADGLVVDGVDAVRKAVREEIKHGSDWIKVLASGAMMSAGNDPNKAHFSPEELRRDRRRSLAPRRAGGRALTLGGGNQSGRPRGRALDRARHLRRRRGHPAAWPRSGVYLVPTLYVGDYYLNEQPGSEAQAKMNELTRKYRAQHIAAVGKAIKAGVHDRRRHGLRRLPGEAGRARTRVARRGRHDADAGDPGGHARRIQNSSAGRTASAPSSPASSPTSSRCQATRCATCRCSRRFRS